MFLEAPLGTGAGSFEPRATERFENEKPNCFGIQADELALTPSAHNTYLRVAVESGALGALALFAYWAMLIVAPLRAGERPDAWIAGFALVLAAGLTIDTLHWRQLWLYAGVLSAYIGAPHWPLRGRSR
jgi:O-antigen ligase